MVQIVKRLKQNELKEWCEKELGDGYTVEIANKNNAGYGYDTAVVVTKITKTPLKAAFPSLDSPPTRVRPWPMSVQMYK